MHSAENDSSDNDDNDKDDDDSLTVMMITIMIFVVILTDCENDDIFHKVEKWEVRDDVRMMMMVRNYCGDYDDNNGVGSNHLQGRPSPVNQLCILDMPPLFLQSLSISPVFSFFSVSGFPIL